MKDKHEVMVKLTVEGYGPRTVALAVEKAMRCLMQEYSIHSDIIDYEIVGQPKDLTVDVVEQIVSRE